MMTEQDGINKLRRLAESTNPTALDTLREIGSWAKFADQALADGRIQDTRIFLAVIMAMCGETNG